jgi:3,4-dihydroxy-2-butanone 4-phosphate synthase
MLPPYTITRRQGESSCYAITVHHNKTTRGIIMLCYNVHHSKTTEGIIMLCYHRTPNKTTRGIIMLCYHRTAQQDDGGLYHAMLPPYTTITRRQGASSCYAITVHHSKTTEGIIMLCYHRTPNKTTRGIIMLYYHRTAQQDDGGLYHAMLPPCTTITRRQGASSCYAITVHHSKTTEGIIMLC